MIEITPDGQLNYEKIVKGDFISEDVLRAVTGFDPKENFETYAFAVLRIRATLEKEHNLIPRGEGYALRVLTTNEATFYAVKQARKARKRQRKNLGRLLKLDEQEMDETTRVQHRKHLEHETQFDSAQKSVWKKIRVSPTRQQSSHNHQDKPIKIVSTKKGKENGTSASQHHTDRNKAAITAQRPDGEPDESNGQTNERTDQQAQ
jgi:hypothetical protein